MAGITKEDGYGFMDTCVHDRFILLISEMLLYEENTCRNTGTKVEAYLYEQAAVQL